MKRYLSKKMNSYIAINHSIYYFPLFLTERFVSIFFTFTNIFINYISQLLQSKNYFSSILFCQKMKGEYICDI